MARRRKRRKWPVILGILIIICAIGFGTAQGQMLPNFFASTKEVIETVRSNTSATGNIPYEEITIAEGDVSGGYYYQQLNEEEQGLYKEMYQGLYNMSASIYMHSPDMAVLNKVSQYIFCDRPELFWCDGEMQMTSYEAHSEIQPSYTYTGEEQAARQAQIDQAVQDCLAGVSQGISEYEKIKYVFEYIVNTVDYNLEAADNQNIYSALVTKSSVCAGYSRAAQYLLQRLGVECIYVTGNIPEQGAHAWNIVKCNGQYYHMDVTFGDPVFLGTEGGGSPQPQSINYDYLCSSDAEIMKSHTVDTMVSYPQCTSMDLNYYMLNGMYYDDFDPEKLLQDMNSSIYNQQSSFTCKFANDSLYQEAHDMVLNDLLQRAAQNLLSYYGLESVQYTYVEDDIMAKITIFWNYQ